MRNYQLCVLSDQFLPLVGGSQGWETRGQQSPFLSRVASPYRLSLWQLFTPLWGASIACLASYTGLISPCYYFLRGHLTYREW